MSDLNKEHWILSETEGLIQEIINNIVIDDKSDESTIKIGYYLLWTVKHFLVCLDYSHNYILDRGIISKIIKIMNILPIQLENNQDLLRDIKHCGIQIMTTISKDLEKWYHFQVNEFIDSIGIQL